MQLKKILSFFLLLNCVSGACLPQANFFITKLTQDDGLSQGSNYFRFEDSKGFMWITGNDAVNRYDGKKVKVYNLDKYFKGCPNLQQGYGFAEDNEGNIYIGSTKGLYIYHRNKDKFTLKKIFNNDPDEIAMPFGYREGKVWCFNRQYQLAAYDVAGDKVEYCTQLNLKPLPSVHIYQLEGNVFYHHFPFIDVQGNCWLIGNKNIACYNIQSKISSYPLEKQLLEKNITIYSSTYDSASNNILFGTATGLLQYNITERTTHEIISIYSKPMGHIELLAVNKDYIALKDENGMALLSKDYSNRLWTDYEQKKYWRTYQYGFDKSGRLWFCNDGSGQVIFDFHPRLLNKENGEGADFFEAKQLALSGTGIFAELPNGDMLIQQRVVQSRQNRGLYPLPVILPDSVFSRNASDPYRKGVWFVNYINNQKQLTRVYFLNNKNEITIFFTEGVNDNLDQHQDIQVLPDGKVMCSYANGLFLLDTEKRALIKVNALTQKSPFKINPLSHGRVAVSYLNNDMLLANFLPGGNANFLQKILPGVQSFYIQEDSALQRYWVGTNKGVYLLDKNFAPVQVFDANNGLAGTYIYGILLDGEGNAWCSHQHGLSSINAKTLQVINYDKSDGIQDWDFNNRAFYKATDGTLFFGGVSGFNFFKPPLTQYAFYNAEVYIDEIEINNNTYLPDTNANLIKKIDLDYTENNITIKAILKDLSNSGMRQLIYRIRNTDKKWKIVPGNGLIIFSSLAPGNYIVELGNYDKYNNKESLQKTLIINIASPFYRKLWFWAFMGIISTTLILGLLYRRRLIKQQNIFQQQLALQQQRNKITADLHDDIGASLSSLQVNSAVANKLIDKDVSKTKDLLKKIETQSQNIAEKIGDIIWSMKPGKDEFMTLGTRIRNFANDMIGATNTNYKVEVSPMIDKGITDITVRKNILLVTKEAVNNAVKYSTATEINISLAIKGNQLILVVADNGRGFDTAVVKGNGMENMKKRIQEISGEFIVESLQGKGTTITACVPLVP